MPPLLLLTMYALAARYTAHRSPTSPRPSSPRAPTAPAPMWPAGDDYLEQAKHLLSTPASRTAYTTSLLPTCQALLLLGYREIGIGAMAHAWGYVGLAIRMAQDLGMHRCADGWVRGALGGHVFGAWEGEERRRVWAGCVVMDRYVSSYIGRPLMVRERDWDTRAPDVADVSVFCVFFCALGAGWLMKGCLFGG